MKHEIMSFDEWMDRFKPEPIPDGLTDTGTLSITEEGGPEVSHGLETYGNNYLYVESKLKEDPNKVWSMIAIGGELAMISGHHEDEAIFYTVTEVPCPKDTVICGLESTADEIAQTILDNWVTDLDEDEIYGKAYRAMIYGKDSLCCEKEFEELKDFFDLALGEDFDCVSLGYDLSIAIENDWKAVLKAIEDSGIQFNEMDLYKNFIMGSEKVMEDSSSPRFI